MYGPPHTSGKGCAVIQTFTRLSSNATLTIEVQVPANLEAMEQFRAMGLDPRDWHWTEQDTVVSDFLTGVRKLLEPVGGWDSPAWWETQ